MIRRSPGRHSAEAARPQSPTPGTSRRRGTTRRRAIVAAGTVALVGSGVAVAAWTISGSGPGAAKAVNPGDLGVRSSVADPDLYPGATGDVVVEVSNPNDYDVVLQSATVTSVSPSGTCSEVTGLGPIALPDVPVESGAEFVRVVVPDAVTMLPAAEDDCKNATFVVQVSLSGMQA